MKFQAVVFFLAAIALVPGSGRADEFEDFNKLPDNAPIQAREDQPPAAPQVQDVSEVSLSQEAVQGEEALPHLEKDPAETQSVVEAQNEKAVESDVKKSIESATAGAVADSPLPIPLDPVVAKDKKNESAALKVFYSKEKQKKQKLAKAKKLDKKKKIAKHDKKKKSKIAKHIASKSKKKIAKVSKKSKGRSVASVDRSLPKKRSR